MNSDSGGGYFNYEAQGGVLNISGNGIVGNPNMGSITDKTASVNFLGQGNRIYFAEGKELLIGRVNDVNTGNDFSVNVASISSDARNILYVDKIFVYGGINYSGEETSTTKSVLSFKGNTYLDSGDGSGTNVYLNPQNNENIWYGNWNGYNGGSAKLLVSSSNNELWIKDLILNDKQGDVPSYKSAKAIFEVSDSGNTIYLTNLYANRNKHNASSLIKIEAGNQIEVSGSIYADMEDNLRFEDVFDTATGEISNGTLFAFKSDAQADVSTIKYMGIDGGTLQANSFLLLDFSDVLAIKGTYEDKMIFEDFSSISGSILQNVYLTFDGESYFALNADGTFSNEIYGFVLNQTDGGLGYSLSIIPEPSAYAAIFSLFALFIAYRQKR